MLAVNEGVVTASLNKIKAEQANNAGNGCEGDNLSVKLTFTPAVRYTAHGRNPVGLFHVSFRSAAPVNIFVLSCNLLVFFENTVYSNIKKRNRAATPFLLLFLLYLPLPSCSYAGPIRDRLIREDNAALALMIHGCGKACFPIPIIRYQEHKCNREFLSFSQRTGGFP